LTVGNAAIASSVDVKAALRGRQADIVRPCAVFEFDFRRAFPIDQARALATVYMDVVVRIP